MTQEPQSPDNSASPDPYLSWSAKYDQPQDSSPTIPAPPPAQAEPAQPGYPTPTAAQDAPPASPPPAFPPPAYQQTAPPGYPQADPSAYYQGQPAATPAQPAPWAAQTGYPQAAPPGYPQTSGQPTQQAPAWSAPGAPIPGAPMPGAPMPIPGAPPLQPYYAEPAPAKTSSALGITGGVIVTLCAIVGCVSAWMTGALLGGFMLIYGTTSIKYELLTAAEQAQASAVIMPGVLASVVGVAGFVLSIVAVVKKNGRPWGIAGIILGILAPLAMFGLTMLGVFGVVGEFIY